MEELGNNKKILIVTECFYPEEFKINDVATFWKCKNYNVDVLTLSPTYPLGEVYKGYKNKIFSKETHQGINIFRVLAITGYKESLNKKLMKYLVFLVLGSIVSIFIGRRYDYIFGYNISSLTNMIPAVLIKKLYNKPLMFWVQDVWPDSVYAYGFQNNKILSFFLDAFVKKIFRSVTSIAISGRGFETVLKPYVKEDMLFHYLPNWADDLNMDLKKADFGDPSKTNFTFAGNVGKMQNLENIVKAFFQIPKTYQDRSQLNIVGDGSNLKSLKKLCINKKNIFFHGKKSRKEMGRYYKASDFLIVSLIDEPIFSVTVPAKLQTYIAAKKPILAIIKGDTADIVKENNLGLCADPSGIADITEKFIKCIGLNKTERLRFVCKNDHLLSTTFSKENTINKLLDILVGKKSNTYS